MKGTKKSVSGGKMDASISKGCRGVFIGDQEDSVCVRCILYASFSTISYVFHYKKLTNSRLFLCISCFMIILKNARTAHVCYDFSGPFGAHG